MWPTTAKTSSSTPWHVLISEWWFSWAVLPAQHARQITVSSVSECSEEADWLGCWLALGDYVEPLLGGG